MHDVSHKYFKKIKDLCIRRGLQLIYLDSADIFRKTAEKSGLFFAKDAELQKTWRRLPEAELQLKAEELFRLEAEAEFSSAIERGENIIDQIGELNPDVVIISEGLANMLMVLYPEQAAKIKVYKQEKPKRSEIYRKGLELVQEEPNKAKVLGVQFIRRKYYATTTWRVLPDKTPNFIGTWDTAIRSRGLFEVYIGADGEGLVQDCLGTAKVRLERYKGGIIHFIKEYKKGECCDVAIMVPLHYYLTPVDDLRYEGLWKFANGRTGGSVIMFLGDKFVV